MVAGHRRERGQAVVGRHWICEFELNEMGGTLAIGIGGEERRGGAGSVEGHRSVAIEREAKPWWWRGATGFWQRK